MPGNDMKKLTIMLLLVSSMAKGQQQVVADKAQYLLNQFPWKGEAMSAPLENGKYGLIIGFMADSMEVDTGTAKLVARMMERQAIADSVSSYEWVNITYVFTTKPAIIFNFLRKSNHYELKKP